jgi:hypothetical protein
MRRAVLALTAILVIVFLIQPLAQFEGAKANPFSFSWVNVQEPMDYTSHKIYQTSDIPLKIYAYGGSVSNTQFISISYSLDDNSNITLNIFKIQGEQNSVTGDVFSGCDTLANLSFGYHTIKAYATTVNGKVKSDSTEFFVNVTSNRPLIILSPLDNSNYDSNGIPITCIIDKQLNIEYSLDNKGFISSPSNVTLTQLSEGQHTVIVKAVSEYGTYSEQTISFTVEKPQMEIFGNTFIIAIVAVPAAIGCIAVGLLLFRRHRKTANPHT